MTIRVEDVIRLLCCPDDGGELRRKADGMQCTSCERQFPLYAQNLTEILPRSRQELPPLVSAEYREGYRKAFDQTYHDDNQSLAWGAEEQVPESWRLKRIRQVEFVCPLITQGTRGDGALCDISGGAGYYTLAYAKLFRSVLHCDLSVENLSYVRRKASALGIENVFFVRMDYFAPPFRNSLDRLICMDTLIRGEAHESLLLGSIASCLTSEGFALVDFHNWLHNPLRRLGLLQNNFEQNGSYTKRELNRLLKSRHIVPSGFFSFRQEFAGNGTCKELLRRAIPATRFLFQIQRTP